MLSFSELARPTFGWKLEEIRDHGVRRDRPFWSVKLLFEDGDGVVESIGTSLEEAWNNAVRGAITYRDAWYKDQYSESPAPQSESAQSE